MTITIIVAIFAIALIFGIRNQRRLKKQGFTEPMLLNRKYIMGHPDVDKSAPMIIAFKEMKIHLLNANTNLSVASISNELIKSVNIEDKSSMQSRVSLGRMALFGLFAFAMKKSKKDEFAYLVIDWNDGRDDHATVFEYQGRGSTSKANGDRNVILRMIR